MRAVFEDPSGIDDPIQRWLDARYNKQMRHDVDKQLRYDVDHMDIGDFNRFLKWAADDKMATALLRKSLKRDEDRRFVVNELPEVLIKLNGYRNHAAHAGAPVKEREAKDMYETLMGTGERESLLARLVSLAARP